MRLSRLGEWMAAASATQTGSRAKNRNGARRVLGLAGSPFAHASLLDCADENYDGAYEEDRSGDGGNCYLHHFSEALRIKDEPC